MMALFYAICAAGPKMGPRPPDFNEQVLRQSPTFARWAKLDKGEKLRYACRDFVKGHEDDEERLLRRIMIARRNNVKGKKKTQFTIAKRQGKLPEYIINAVHSTIILFSFYKDHEILKRARNKVQDKPPADEIKEEVKEEEAAASTTSRKRRPASSFSDTQVAKEMDVAAVEATRSYRAWMALEDGKEFVYNQKYIKGKEGHDWLLRKNIWRRMRYRRENKNMVTRLIENDPNAPEQAQRTASQIVDQALSPLASKEKEETGDISARTRARSSVDSNTKDQGAVALKKAAGTKRVTSSIGNRKAAKVTKTEDIDSTIFHGGPNSGATASSAVDHKTADGHPDDDDTNHAALTAAAAATASGADDLVELSAVEAAVAAAADYVQLTTQQATGNEEDDDEAEEEDHGQTTTVHNPLEAAANAAALDSAAKLAAAAAAQESEGGDEDEENENIVVV